MTIAQPEAPSQDQNTPCPKCSSRVSRIERDDVGLIRTCANCGYCTYMNRDGQVTEEQRILEERIVTHTETEARPREEHSLSQEAGPDSGAGTGAQEAAAEGTLAEQWPSRGATQQPVNGAIARREEADNAINRQEEMGDAIARQEEVDGRPPEGPEVAPISIAGTECSEDNETPTAADTPEEGREACAQCNEPRDAEYDLRFIRGPLRNCGNCGAWEVNPAFQEDPPDNHGTTILVLQTSCAGVPPYVVEKIILEITGATLPKNTLPSRCRRYGGPPSELTQELKVTTGSQWNLTGVEIKRGGTKMWCWAVADSTTQYILATDVTTENRPGEELLQKASEQSSQAPESIRITSQSPELGQEQTKMERRGWRIIREDGPEDRNSSLGKIRQAMENRFGSKVGPALGKSMVEEILRMASMSINLLEPSPMLSGVTPAEAAMAEPPFSNWTELVKWSSSQRPAKPRSSRTPENQEGSGATNGDKQDAHTAEGKPQAKDSGEMQLPEDGDAAATAAATETTPAPEGSRAQTARGRKPHSPDARFLEEIRELRQDIIADQQRLIQEYEEKSKDRRAVETTIRLLEQHPSRKE